MKEHETFPGKLYAVMCATGCTLTDDSGRNEEIEAGKQFTFIATAGKVYTSEPAIVKLATFNRAASALGLLGGGVKINWDKYAECVKETDLAAVNADYKNDLTAKREWKWRLPKLNSGYKAFENTTVRAFYSDLPVLASGSHMFNGSQIVVFKGDLSNVTNAWRMFNGTPLEVFDSTLNKLIEGLDLFSGCKLNKQSALNVLHSILGSVSSVMRITLGIHVDHRNDEDIASAVEVTQAAGWIITLQWNGTPTASAANTFSLRRCPVWAKRVEAPDGSEVLNWGHYVTNAEENGYTEFASLAEAKEYFNITD